VTSVRPRLARGTPSCRRSRQHPSSTITTAAGLGPGRHAAPSQPIARAGPTRASKGYPERVRTIFQRYLELGSIGLLLADLRGRGIVTKIRHLSDGRTVGGIPFTRGSLAHLLRNRFYIGEVVFKSELCPAEHPPILDRDLFEAVQRKLAEQRNGYRAARASPEALLIGRIFDDRGNRMSPSHTRKGATRHRYYVSSALIQGRLQSAGSVARVPAAKVEAAIVDAVRRQIRPDAPSDDTEMITTCVRRIEVRRTEIAISLANEERDSEEETIDPAVLTVPWSKTIAIATSSSPMAHPRPKPVRSAPTPGSSSSPRSRAHDTGSPRSRPAPRRSTPSPHVSPAASATFI
jgi:hypothetical protein